MLKIKEAAATRIEQNENEEDETCVFYISLIAAVVLLCVPCSSKAPIFWIF